MGEAKRRKQTGAPAPVKKPAKGKSWMISVSVSLVAIIVMGVIFATRPPGPDSPGLPDAAETADQFPAQLDRFGISVGSEDAPVVVREFADYQCPACAMFSEASQRLKNTYVKEGKVRFVYFDLPLRQHKNAVPAAMAARCAGDQEAYWPMHDRLFATQGDWGTADSPADIFTRYAERLELDARRFRNCLASDLHLEAVKNSQKVAMQVRATSTPTVMVDNIRLTQTGWPQLSAVVERELAATGE